MSKLKRQKSFIIFFSVVFVIYFALHIPLFITGNYLLSAFTQIQPVFKLVFILLASSFFAGRIMERIIPSLFSDAIVFAGSLWLGALLYFYLLYFAGFIILMLLKLTVWLGVIDFQFNDTIKISVFITALAITMIILLIGFINAQTPVVRQLQFNVNKNGGKFKSLKIALATDIHAGIIIGKKRLTRIINKINAVNADIILLAGDLVDDDINRLINKDLGKIFSLLKASYGVFATTGNHEYIGNAGKAINYFEKNGVRFLNDEQVMIADSFIVIGRKDKDAVRFSASKRKTITELLAGVDFSKPIIMLDHQPAEVKKIAENRVDICFSGHTHHGQLWPLNYITKAIYKLSWGYQYLNSTHYYVSCGAGSWGPPVRLGNRPEIVAVTVVFQ